MNFTICTVLVMCTRSVGAISHSASSCAMVWRNPRCCQVLMVTASSVEQSKILDSPKNLLTCHISHPARLKVRGTPADVFNGIEQRFAISFATRRRLRRKERHFDVIGATANGCSGDWSTAWHQQRNGFLGGTQTHLRRQCGIFSFFTRRRRPQGTVPWEQCQNTKSREILKN